MLGLGLWLGLSSVYADQLNLAGAKTADFGKIDQAAKIFPLDWYIRTKPGYFFIETRQTSFKAEETISRVLRTDPYSVDLLTALYIQQLAFGEQRQALATSQLIRKLAPRARFIQELSGVEP